MANLPASAASGLSEALALDLEQPGLPALRVEVAGRGRLVLRQNDAVVLLARVDDDHFGVEYAVTGRFCSPIPPIRAAQAAAIGSDNAGAAPSARWAYHFAAALTETAGGPLHTGRWILSPEATHLRPTDRKSTPAERWSGLLLPQSQGYIDWFRDNGAGRVLPLRPLAGSDTGRVKSYRKQVEAGVLAPLLLWWISGLDCYVVLDGHDRLVAALAENREPPLLALSSVNHRHVTRDTEVALHRYHESAEVIERHVAHGTPGSVEALAGVNRRLADDLRDIETGYGATRAWPLPGGTASWNALAAARTPTWYAETASDRPPLSDHGPRLG